jgi:hypothetical protein
MSSLRNFPRFKMDHIQTLSVTIGGQAAEKILDVAIGGIGLITKFEPNFDFAPVEMSVGKTKLKAQVQLIWYRKMLNGHYRMGLRLVFEQLNDYKAWEVFQKALWNKRQ